MLVHGFRGFSPWLTGSIAFRPVARQKDHHALERERMEESCSLHSSWEAERERQEGTRDKIYPSKACPQ
jgi:hypothetical protein